MEIVFNGQVGWSVALILTDTGLGLLRDIQLPRSWPERNSKLSRLDWTSKYICATIIRANIAPLESPVYYIYGPVIELIFSTGGYFSSVLEFRLSVAHMDKWIGETRAFSRRWIYFSCVFRCEAEKLGTLLNGSLTVLYILRYYSRGLFLRDGG